MLHPALENETGSLIAVVLQYYESLKNGLDFLNSGVIISNMTILVEISLNQCMCIERGVR